MAELYGVAPRRAPKGGNIIKTINAAGDDCIWWTVRESKDDWNEWYLWIDHEYRYRTLWAYGPYGPYMWWGRYDEDYLERWPYWG